MKVVYNDEMYGELGYNKQRLELKKIDPILLPFNGKDCKINFYIGLVDISYMEAKYNLTKYFKIEDFPEDIVKENEELERKQRELYKKYLAKPLNNRVDFIRPQKLI